MNVLLNTMKKENFVNGVIILVEIVLSQQKTVLIAKNLKFYTIIK
jgi:hypothetical protein